MNILTAPYDNHVFINCPFDSEYKPIFDAIVFAIHDAGFVARCSLEVIDSGQTRLEKIISIIRECKYGIHDISRTETSSKSRLPRFNMPFECGLYWGCWVYGDHKHKTKRTLILDSSPYRYRTSLSDVAGQDIQVHKNNPRIAIDKVRSWLNTGSGRTTIPGGTAIWARYVLFQNDLRAILKRAGITRAELSTPQYFPDYVQFIYEWLKAREVEANRQPMTRASRFT